MQEDSECGGVDRIIDLGVAEDDERTFPAHLQRKPLKVARGFNSKITSGLGRPGDGDHTNPGIVQEDGADRSWVTRNNVKHPRWQARLLEYVGDQEA